MATRYYGFTALTGEGTGALDKYPESGGPSLATGDTALGVVSDVFYLYQFDGASSAAESVPSVIAPSSGTGRWELKFNSDAVNATTGTFGTVTTTGNIELGHASDTTLSRTGAGNIAVEGNAIYRAGGTDVPVTDGGTGASTLTDHGILLGSGTAAITPLGVATNGQLPIGSTGADPVLAAITPGDGIDVTNAAGSITVAVDLKANGGLVIDTTELTVDLSASAITGTLAVADGGTGASTLTDHGILLGSGTAAVTPLGVATNGQLPIGSTGADPVLATLTAGDGIDVTNAAGSISIATDLKANGGIVIETSELAVDLGASSITGTLAVADGGTGRVTGTTAYSLIATGTTATGAQQTLANGATTEVLVGGGASALPVWGTNIPTAVTIGNAYIYRAGGTDVPVADGGTGASTLTDHGVLLGSGTGAITPMTALAAGEIIVGVGGADPHALAAGATTKILVGGGAADPVWTTATGSGAPVRATAPTIASPSYTGTFGFAPATELTIATGAITAAQTIHLVDTESDAATDDLVTINGGADGLQLEIRAAHADRTVVIKETGNILTGGSDIRLDDTNKYILFTYDGALSKWVVVGGSGGVGFATAAEITTGTEAAKAVAPDQLKLAGIIPANIFNLKPVVNAAVNKLDIFTKSGSAVPDATNPIRIMIPDGNGNTLRSRADAYLSGTSQFIMADATNYWNKGSLDAEIKNGYLYAIWDGTGIVWALGGYSGFNVVPTTTTVTDDDYFLLEASSTYTRSNSHYCVAVAKIRYQYDTTDTPNHTIQATVIDAPQVIWNPKSDYGYSKNLTSSVSSEVAIGQDYVFSIIVKQSGRYIISGQVTGSGETTYSVVQAFIKTGSATYASASYKGRAMLEASVGSAVLTATIQEKAVYLNSGDTIHLGCLIDAAANTRWLYGDDAGAGLYVGSTTLFFQRID